MINNLNRSPSTPDTAANSRNTVVPVESMEEMNSNGRPRAIDVPDLLYTATGDV